MEILYEDAHLVLVNKPAGIPTQGAGESLETRVRSHLSSRPDQDVYLGTVHRLDKPVSGVIAWAKTPKAARRLASRFAGREVRKEYWALVDHAAIARQGTWSDWLIADRSIPGKFAIGRESDPGARLAVTHYERRDEREAAPAGVWRSGGNGDRHLEDSEPVPVSARPLWLVLHPETGRTHQLRVQCGVRSMPIVGDARYGSARSFSTGIALHARRLIVPHPMMERIIDIVAELPPSWEEWSQGRS